MSAALSGTSVPSLQCPSSPLEEFTLNKGTFAAIADYVAIAGNVGGFGGVDGPTTSESPFSDTFGIISQNGVLYNNSKTGFGDISDGSSNTIVISEVSDFIYVAGSAGPEPRDYRPGGRGETSTDNGPGFHAGWQVNTNPDSLHNCTSIRYLANPGPSVTFTTDTSDGVNFRGYNSPLRSAHTGGVQVGLGDGSVHFISDSLAAAVLAKLANRSDGQTNSEF